MYILQIYKLELTKKNFQYSYLVILVNTFPTSESWLTSYSPPQIVAQLPPSLVRAGWALYYQHLNHINVCHP